MQTYIIIVPGGTHKKLCNTIIIIMLFITVVGNIKDLGAFCVHYNILQCYIIQCHVDHSNCNCLIGWRKAKEFVGFSFWDIDIP